MKDQAVNTTKQSFPPLDIQLLESGHVQFDDPTYEGGVVHVHPAQLQVAAQLIGLTLTDPTRKALGRVLARVQALHDQADRLNGLLGIALKDGESVGAEFLSSELLATNLALLAQDLADLCSPALEPIPDGPGNPGGQLTLV